MDALDKSRGFRKCSIWCYWAGCAVWIGNTETSFPPGTVIPLSYYCFCSFILSNHWFPLLMSRMSTDSKNATQTDNSEICWEMNLNGDMRRKCHASEKVDCDLDPFWVSCFTLLIRSAGRCLELTFRIVYWLCSRTLTEPSSNGWLGLTSELLRGIKEQYIKSGQQKREQLRCLPTGFKFSSVTLSLCVPLPKGRE